MFTTNISHPTMFDVTSGRTTVEGLVESIDESIELILKTEKGELYGNPNFGGLLHSYFFTQMSESLIPELKINISSWLNEQETRIYVDPNDINIRFLYNKKTVSINISYNIRYSDITSSFSVLFFINEEETL